MPLVDLLKSIPSLDLSAPLMGSEIDAFQASLPGPLPGEVRELLEYASGFKAPFGYIDFTGKSNRFSFKEIFPYGLPVAQRDGDFWIVDIDQDGRWQCVFFVSHDPAVALIQFPSFSDFIQGVVAKGDVLVDAKNFASRVWGDGSSGIQVNDARNSPDTLVSSFASDLSDNFEIYDLRFNKAGSGFAWGRSGPDTDCRRLNTQLLFGVEKVVPKKGFLQKLFR
ncbi:SMI1/KNR4 family protein [Burkholderia pseudomallei]